SCLLRPFPTRRSSDLTARLPGFGQAPDLEGALAELDAMVGLEPVKRQVRAIAAQLRVAKLREEQGLRAQPPMRHFVFSRPPGTGKTSVARVLGRVFAALGLLTRSEVVEAQRSDLVGEHLGATAIKTNALVDRALGGVLFIDEAYALANPGYSGGDAFGAEAIQTLLKRAEDDRSRLVIVLAGYPGEMDRLLASNAGLASRFNVRVGFPSYTADQLTEIAETVADRTGDAFDDSALEDLRRIFGYVCEEGWIDELGNGRFARSLFEKACSQRDLRVAEEPGEAADRPTTAGPVLPHRGRRNTPALEAPARPARGRRGAAARPAGARGRYRSRPVRVSGCSGAGRRGRGALAEAPLRGGARSAGARPRARRPHQSSAVCPPGPGRGLRRCRHFSRPSR